MEKLIEHPWRHRIVMAGVRRILRSLNIDNVIPVPNGALKIAQPLADEINVIPSEKIKPLEFSIPETSRQTITQAGRIAIFEDVVTTGSNQFAMAREVLNINPDTELHLIGLWRRGTLHPSGAAMFESRNYLVEEPIPAWPGYDCYDTRCDY